MPNFVAVIDIGQHIEYLLAHHDCVVVPGMGAFIASRTAARYDQSCFTFMPPRREVRFNAEVRHDDGLLVQSVVRRHGLQPQAASQAIEQWALSPGPWQIGRVGCLVPSAEAGVSPQFQPAEGSLATSLWEALPKVQILPEQKETAVPDSTKTLTNRVRRPRAWLRIAAMLVGVAALASMFVVAPQVLDRGSSRAAVVGMAELSRALSERGEGQGPREEAQMSGRELYIALPSRDEVITDCNDLQPYLVVVATAADEACARWFINKHKADHLTHMFLRGYHRVIAGSAPTMQAAIGKAVQLHARYPGAWACKN